MPNPTPPPWGPETHKRTVLGEEYRRLRMIPEADYRAACRAVNREAAGEALAEAARIALKSLRSSVPPNPDTTRWRANKLAEALAAWEAAGKEEPEP